MYFPSADYLAETCTEGLAAVQPGGRGLHSSTFPFNLSRF